MTDRDLILIVGIVCLAALFVAILFQTVRYFKNNPSQKRDSQNKPDETEQPGNE